VNAGDVLAARFDGWIGQIDAELGTEGSVPRSTGRQIGRFGTPAEDVRQFARYLGKERLLG
jgi:hypothetical protein